MNVASRMESHGARNRVNMSAAARRLLQAQAPEVGAISRGLIAIKGKGEARCESDPSHPSTLHDPRSLASKP